MDQGERNNRASGTGALNTPDVKTASDQVSDTQGTVSSLQTEIDSRDRAAMAAADAERKERPLNDLKASIASAIGSSNRDVPRINEVQLSGSMLVISYTINDNLAKSWIKGMALDDMAKIIKTSQSSAVDWQTIDVQGTFPLTDRFGNTKEGIILHGQWPKGTIDRINWSGFNAENLPTITEDFFFHPAFDK